MMGRVQISPGWADDPVWRQDSRIRWGRLDIGQQEGRVGRANKCT